MISIYWLLDPRNERPRYVGQTSAPLSSYLRKKIRQDSKSLHSNKRINWIKSLVRKNLSPKIELIAQVADGDWIEAEKSYIRLLKACGANLVNGNEGGVGHSRSTKERKPRKHSQETKDKISLAGKRRPPCSQETRDKLSRAHKGKVISEEQREKISKAKRGTKASSRAKQNMSISRRKSWERSSYRTRSRKLKKFRQYIRSR